MVQKELKKKLMSLNKEFQILLLNFMIHMDRSEWLNLMLLWNKKFSKWIWHQSHLLFNSSSLGTKPFKIKNHFKMLERSRVRERDKNKMLIRKMGMIRVCLVMMIELYLRLLAKWGEVTLIQYSKLVRWEITSSLTLFKKVVFQLNRSK